MSHELRTPLNAIIGFTGIILQGLTGEINTEQRKQITMTQNSAHHLLALINDVIDVSKIEGNSIEPFIEEFDLLNMVQEVKDSFNDAAAEKGLQLSLMMPKTVVIKSDERRTKQILLNFMSNAVKFTDEGEIEIKFSENQISFSFENCYVLSRLIEGEYPNYKNVIPEKRGDEIRIDREKFLSATRRASIFTDQDSMAIKLDIKKKKVTISKNTPYLGEAKEEIDADYTGENDMEIGFNPRYLIDVLKNLSDQEIAFEVSGADKPGVVRRGGEYTYVVLPMQITQ